MSQAFQAEARAAALSGRRGSKSATAFRTISEVANELDVPQHVLRFWESKFSQVKPLKRGGGRRYYRPEDVALLRSIRSLLYREGYTIKGVQKLMREGNIQREGGGAAEPVALRGRQGPAPAAPAVARGDGGVAGGGTTAALSARQRAEIEAVLAELTEIRKLLCD